MFSVIYAGIFQEKLTRTLKIFFYSKQRFNYVFLNPVTETEEHRNYEEKEKEEEEDNDSQHLVFHNLVSFENSVCFSD